MASSPLRPASLQFALIACLFWATLLSSARLTQAAPAPKDQPVASAKAGSAIFHKRCIVCHNKQPGDTSPFGPPNLYIVFRHPAKLTAQQAEEIVTHGRGQMPTFGQILSKSEIRNVIAYLRTRAR